MRRIKLLGSYKLSTKRCRFKCLVCGHKWKALAADVINRFGCRQCSRKRVGAACRLGIDEIKGRLKKLKSPLSLLSKEYVGTTSPLEFKCRKCGTKVRLSWESLVRSRGRCATCTWSAKKLTLKEVKRRLKRVNPNLKILSQTYSGTESPLRCFCLQCGRTSSQPWHYLMYGRCVRCSGLEQLTLKQVKKRLKRINPNLKVVSREYKNSSTPLRCKCKTCGVSFSKPWSSLCQGIKGCECRQTWMGEEEVRKLLEDLTGWKFPKASSSSVPFLHGMHLDGYNEEHRIGYEFQGPQHYRLVNFGGGKDTPKKLRNRKLNDDRKRKQCARHGVFLIVVPHWKRNVKQFLEEKLKKWRKEWK